MTSPWVEQASIVTDVGRREVRFNLKDKAAFNADEVTKALNHQRFPEVTVRSAPSK